MKENESLRYKVVKNSFWNFLASIIGRGGAVFFTILLARFLLPEGFGLYSLASSVAFMFLTFADLGINQAMIRFVSSELHKNIPKAAMYFKFALKIKFLVALAVSVILIIISYPLSYFIFNKPEIFPLLLLFSPYVMFLALIGFFESTFYLKDNVNYLAFKEALLQFSRISLVSLVFFLLPFAYYLSGVIFALLFSSLIVLAFVFFISKRITGSLFTSSNAKIDKADFIKFVFYLTLANLSLLFFSYIDSIVLGIFVSAEYIGYYKAAFNIIFGIAGLISFVNVLLPVLTTLLKNRLQDAYNKIIRYSALISVPSSLGIMALSRYIIKLVYGDSFMPAVGILTLISVLIIMTTNMGIFITLFSAKKKPEKFAKITLYAGLLNLFLNFLFVYLFSDQSELFITILIAIATLISWVFYSIVAVRLIKKELNVNFPFKFFIRPLIAAGIMLFVLEIFNNKITDMNLLLGFLEVAFGMLIYLAVILILKGITKEDLLFFFSLFNRPLAKSTIKESNE